MGAAGDTLIAALLELADNKTAFLEKMSSLDLPGVAISAAPAIKCGITGTRVVVMVHGEEEVSYGVFSEGYIYHYNRDHNHSRSHEHGHEHEYNHRHEHHQHNHDHGHHYHTGMKEIRHPLGHLELSEVVRANAEAAYGLITEAESRTHGAPVEEIHFYEVDSLDAAADVVGVCLLVHVLGVGRIVASLTCVGDGQVCRTHGILSVLAPATAHTLQDVPIYGGVIREELYIPTGAALPKYFATEFDATPVMKVEKIGYGMGNKDSEAANCARALLGETAGGGDKVAELRCNLDDMTTEALGFAQEELLAAGALDIYIMSIDTKRGRPVVLFFYMCRMEDRERLLGLLLQRTATLGVWENVYRRYTLERGERTVDTPHGPV